MNKIGVLPIDKDGLSINKISSRSKHWKIPAKLALENSLKQGDYVELTCGHLSSQAIITTGSSENIGLSSDLLNHFRVPEHQKMHVKSEGSGKFRLGPVIGILTFPHVIAKKDFSRYIPYALRIKKIGLLYVFGPKSINSALKIIQGFYYNETQKIWQERELPFPDVVLDRTYPNSSKTHLELETVIGQNRIFNKKNLINKNNFFKVLHQDSYLRNHIPETRLFHTLSDFDNMLEKHPAIFLKPKSGMKGHGIIQVTKNSDALVCRYVSQTGPETRNITKSSDIFDVLKCISKRKKTYIIQAAIPRMKYNNQIFEFRSMAVKDGRGQWSVPAIFTKTADSNSFLTNISSGAKIIFFKNLMEGIQTKLPYTKKQFTNLLSKLSVKTATILDHHFGPLGKLGIDIIIDASGKPWLIEANGNPGLMPREALAEYPDWRLQMYDYPLAYCLYLSGFIHPESC